MIALLRRQDISVAAHLTVQNAALLPIVWHWCVRIAEEKWKKYKSCRDAM